jgi:hypothetical protein
METLKNLIYSLTCLSFSIVIGAAVYEHLAVVPQWSAAPPASLAMFQGEYGLNAGSFWTKIHPITLLLFISTLVLHWKSERRRNILIAFIGYVLIILVTGIYFVPELMDITGTAYSDTIDEGLQSRASLWETLSQLRLIVIIGLVIYLILGLTKVNAKSNLSS